MLHRMVKIEANDNASQRTKNRIREHGPFFFLKDSAKSVLSLSNKDGILLESHGFDPIIPNENDWFGWLPSEEVTVTTSPFGGFSEMDLGD